MANQTPSNPTEGSVFTNLLQSLARLPTPTCSEDDRCLGCAQCESARQVSRLKRDLGRIQDLLNKLNQFTQVLNQHMTSALDRRHRASSSSDRTPHLLVGPDIAEILSAVTHLKSQLPASYYEFTENGVEGPTTGQAQEQELAPSEHTLNAYTNLIDEHKKCLWCFLAFPEKAKIKKRVLINWWAAHGWIEENSNVDDGVRVKAEQAGEELLELFEQKQLIQRVCRNKRPSDVWWMGPAVRCFINSDEGSKRWLDQTVLLDPSQIGVRHSEVKTVFNVNGRSVDLEVESLAAMKSLCVLHLGRSQNPVSNPRIEVRDFKFMKGLKKLKHLRLLSFQGALSLTSLPSSVCELTGLKVLDLRACQALESLPSKLGDLKNLTHLDLSSACLSLLQMPIGIASLTNLQVLKGFVVNQPKPKSKTKSCSLQDLSKLRKLHALSIFVPDENLLQPRDLEDLFSIDALFKLKIVWKPADALAEVNQGATKLSNQEEESIVLKVAAKLKKLDLWGVPESIAEVLQRKPGGTFPELEKLYIRGVTLGSLNCDRSAEASVKWKARTLRLLSLPKFNMGSEDLKCLFPNLKCLEYNSCPRFYFPDSYEGVWMKKD